MSLLQQAYRNLRKKILRRREPEIESIAARHFTQIREHIARSELDAALAVALEAASIAESSRDPAFMYQTGSALISLGAREHGWRLITNAERIRTGAIRADWNGEDISDRTLLIEWRRGDIGIGIRSVSLVAHAAQRAKRCIVIVEPRLIPLYRRTLPNVEVRSTTHSGGAAAAADVVASFHTLAALFGPGAAEQAAFVPLRADPGLKSEFRRRYLDGSDGPLIGVSWGSKVRSKEFPPLEAWAELMRSVPAPRSL